MIDTAATDVGVRMFEGFSLDAAEVTGGPIRFRLGGSGPPLLLLHGHPRTHTTWHKVAAELRERYTLVCLDLPGFGGSFKPADQPDHANWSKRAKALALVDLMLQLGHENFSVTGHDRGSYVAFRIAMDHPGRVSKLAVLDGVPILEALERCREEFARRWWHWFFYAQPEKPERAIGADPLAWYDGCAETMGQEKFTDFARAVSDPSTIHTMLEDYRAGLTVDVQHDREDLADGRKLQCPLLVLWSERDDLPDLYGMSLRSGSDGPLTFAAHRSQAGIIWRRKPPRRSRMLSMSFSAPLSSWERESDYPRNRRTISRRNLGSSSKA